MKRLLRLVIAGLLIVLGSVLGLQTGLSPYQCSSSLDSASLSNVGGGITLAAPAFAQQLGKSFLEQEAGITCYVNADQSINLAKAKPLFRIVEDETRDYIVGVVELTGCDEYWWPHAWIHQDGWIVVYYPKDEPTSKLFYWARFKVEQGVTTTTLRDILLWLSGQLGLNISAIVENLRYYHFQYPEATKLFIVVDTGTSDDFRYEIPSSITIYEGSYSHYGADIGTGGYVMSPWSSVSIDGSAISSGGGGTYTLVGKLEGRFLASGESHYVKIARDRTGWVGVALFFLYR